MSRSVILLVLITFLNLALSEVCIPPKKTNYYQDRDAIQMIPIQSCCSFRQSTKNFKSKGYHYHENLGWYKYYRTAVTWDQANLACQREGAYLAVPNTRAELELFGRLRRASRTWEHVWIGIHDRFEEGRFITIFNEPAANVAYMKWGTIHIREPNNRHGAQHEAENCLAVSPREDALTDLYCTRTEDFICEKPVCDSHRCEN